MADSKFMPRTKIVRLIVVGTPGHGKSTFLNEIAGEELFRTSAAAYGCTQLGTDKEGNSWEELNMKVIKLQDGEEEYELHVVDTPGFPDPDRTKAKAYYNHVVQKCNSKINGVVFLVRPERLGMELVERYSTLLREFSFLDVPLIMLVNGFEPQRRARETVEQYSKKRDRDAAKFYDFAETIAKVGRLQPAKIFVSYTLEEIENFGTHIAKILARQEPKVSKLRTYDELKDCLEKAEQSDEMAKTEEINLEEAQRKQVERNIQIQLNEESKMRDLAQGKGFDQVNDLVTLVYGLAAFVRFSNPCNAIADESAKQVKQLEKVIDQINQKITEIENYTPEDLLELRERVRKLTKHLIG